MEQTIATPKAGTVNSDTNNIAWRAIFGAALAPLSIAWKAARAGYWHLRNGVNADTTKPLDVDLIARQLAVTTRAKEDASRNLPPSNEDVPSGAQREIIAYFANLRRRARKQAADDAEKLNRILEQIQLPDALAHMRDIPAACENRILRYVADAETRMNNALEREQNEKKHYDAFREKNRLDREAYYPGTGSYFYLSVPLLIGLSGVALTRMIELISGGEASVPVSWIATLSATAIIVPFLLGGSMLRLINHVSQLGKAIGWAGVFAAIAVISGTAIYADFHIASVLANPDVSARGLLEAAVAAPLDAASSIVNWEIFGLVVLTGLLGLLLGYRSDDPYPGYGAAQRAYFKARQAREDASARLRKRINASIDESVVGIANVCKDFKSRVRTCTALVEKSEQTPAALDDYDAELEDACNMVLDKYRAVNAAARQSESPLSFSEHICFNPEGDAAALRHTNGQRRMTELQTAIADLERDADSARQKLRTLNLRIINSFSEPLPVDPD